MRVLLLMRGAPGCGKTTWIKNHNLEDYTLSPDELRIKCSSLELQPTGELKVSQNQENENAVWSILFKLLEHRMSRGEFTVIDATCSKTKDIKQYKELADQYRYRMYIVDFTKVSLETCLKQNKMRPEHKWVPERAIENIYARFATQQIPSGVTIIQPDDFDAILEKPFDVSEYKKIVFIGDIHGCYDTLMQYPDFKNGLRDDTEYIFLGDYIDRGNQNAEVLHWLFSIMDKPNVCLLEGNHEKWIRDYGNSVPAKSREFEHKTKQQLMSGGFDEKMARMLYRKVRQFSHITWNGIEILACHAGIPHLQHNLLYVPSIDFIQGVGRYADYLAVAETWMGKTNLNQYLIHGHRNVEGDETQIADRVFNLEGRVEFGGKLRMVELSMEYMMPEYGYTADGGRIPIGVITTPSWNVVELDDCQPITKELNTEERKVETVADAITYLQNNKYVQEKALGDGISSFNFTREAFFKGNWNRQTVLARGLFIDTINKKIMARSYKKFFNINEVRETELVSLREKLQFPVTAYVKENGFLAIVSYDYINDDLFIASKSTNKGPYVEYIKKAIEPYRERLLEYFRELYKKANDINSQIATFVFECIDVENDPHIIKYDESKLILLDVILNSLDYKALNYKELNFVAKLIPDCPVKEKAFEIKDWDAFRDLYNEIQSEEYQYNGKYIEGFVFVDEAGFMTKCKTGYYNQWKKLRGVTDQTLRRGYITKTGMLTTSLENMYYGFLKDLYKNDYNKETKIYPYKTDIISLREKFLKEN